jgi:hypothetical protein
MFLRYSAFSATIKRYSYALGVLRNRTLHILHAWGMRWRSRLRYCATNRKVAVSIPLGAIGIFHLPNPSTRTLALGLTQPLTEMSTRIISRGVKAAGAYVLQPCNLHVMIVLKSVSLNLLEPSGPLKACNGISVPLHMLHADYGFSLSQPALKFHLHVEHGN